MSTLKPYVKTNMKITNVVGIVYVKKERRKKINGVTRDFKVW